MYSRRAAWTGLALLACVIRASHAQDRVDAERRLDALARISADARARLAAFDDSLAQARHTMQVLTVPPFRMRVEPGLVDLATRGAEIARRELGWTGTALDRVMSREFVVRSEIVRQRFPAEVISSLVVARLDSLGVEQRPIWGRVDTPEVLATWLTQHALQVLAADVDRSFRTWMETTPVFDSVSTERWTTLRLELVSSPVTIAHRCYEQSLTACAKVLGLAPTTDTLIEWFDARARRFIIERSREEVFRRVLATAVTDACVAGDDDACLRVLRRGEILLPIGTQAHRSSLLQHAIQLGGAGAMERLYEPARTPAERIEHVARAPIDSVLSSWVRRVRDTRMPSEDLTPAIGMISLAWVGIFGVLALRSSRWR